METEKDQDQEQDYADYAASMGAVEGADGYEPEPDPEAAAPVQSKLDQIVGDITYRDDDFTVQDWRQTSRTFITDAYADHVQSTAEIRADPSISETEKADTLTLDQFLDQPSTQKLITDLHRGPDGIGLEMHEDEIER